MVTKRVVICNTLITCSILAKIHMVTKLFQLGGKDSSRSILAKIHMVTKQNGEKLFYEIGSILAKIHMVTKPQIYVITYLKTNEY